MGNKISYKIDKSLQVYYGRILEFKLDKIKVERYKIETCRDMVTQRGLMMKILNK